MGKPACSLRTKLIALVAVGLLSCGLAPAVSLADESVAGGFTPPEYENDARSASPDSDLSSAAEGAVLASSLAPNGTSILSVDVILDAADPIIGSFTVDGLTYAVDNGNATLVSVAPDTVADGAVSIPALVTYNDMTYPVTAIGPYAFYLSGATDIALPGSIASIDDHAFRSSDVERIEVAADNPNLTSFDGALYSADLSRLLLIPEGRKGSVLLSCETEVAEPSLFSHCSLADAISVEEGGAAFSSWEGLLYSADGTTLLRVPAGATDITVRDGCTTIAAGAMAGCAKLERINAPASVTSISPDLFTSVPTVSLPAQSALRDETSSGVASSLLDQSNASTDFAPQLTAMVALSTSDGDLFHADPATIELMLPVDGDVQPWQAVGFNIVDDTEDALLFTSGAATLSKAAISNASYNAAMLTTKTVSNLNFHINSELTAAATNSANIYYGKFTGTVAWSSTSSLPQDDDIVEIKVTGFVPYTTSTSNTGAGYTRDEVNARIYSIAGVYPSYTTFFHTGSEVSFGAVYEATSSAPASFRVLGSDLLNRDELFLSGFNHGVILNDSAVSLQYTPWYRINFNLPSDASLGAHRGIVWVSPLTNVYMPKATRPGYVHNGWAKAEGAASADYTPDSKFRMPFASETTLYATWAKKSSYQVTLSKNGGVANVGTAAIYYWPDKGYVTSSNSTDVVESGSSIVSGNPIRVGYDFDGYWSLPTGGTQYVGEDGKLTADAPALSRVATWYAHWRPTECTITLNTGGGSVSGWAETSANQKYTMGYSIESDDITLPSPVRDGYYFAGWTGSNGTTPQTSVKVQKGSTGAKDYDASWERWYEIAYSSAHGVASKSSDQIRSGARSVTLPSVTPEAGYVFNGWKCSAWSGTMAGGSTFTFATAADRTVTADFALTSYTITLNTGGGSVSGWTEASANQEYTRKYDIEAANFTLPTPTRPGYAFIGWSGSNGATPQTDVTVSKGTTGDLSYVASWTSNVYKITLDDNGGSGGAGYIFEKFVEGWYADEAATQVIESVSVPKRNGYAFEGYYYTGPGGIRSLRIDNNGKIISGSGAFSGPVTLVAEWSQVEGLSVYANGGALKYSEMCAWEGDGHWAFPSSISYTIKDDLSLSVVDSAHMERLIVSNDASKVLMGWAESADGPLMTPGTYQMKETKALYAVWKGHGAVTLYANGGGLGYAETCQWSGEGSWGFASTEQCVIDGSNAMTTVCTDGSQRTTVPMNSEYPILGWSRTPDGPALSAGTYAISGDTRFYAIWSGSATVDRFPNGGALMYAESCRWDGDNSFGWPIASVTKYVIKDEGPVEVYADSLRTTYADSDKTSRVLLGWARTPTGSKLSAGTYGGIGRIGLYAFWQTSTVSFDSNGGSGGQSDSVPVTVGEAMPAISKEKPVREGYSFKGWFDGPDYKNARQYYSAECESARRWDIGCDVTLYAGWEPIAYTVSLEDEGETLGSFNLKYGEDLELPKLEYQGWIFGGWEDVETGALYQPGAVRNLRSEDGAHAVLQAKKVAAISADAPIEVTARVDLLGLEEQAEASGYIESRCGAALEVAEVSFEPLEGAAQLFAGHVADVFLEALAEGSTTVDLRFALDAAVTEADASKLGAFALPDGYGTRVGIGYRFDIPDNVLASIDPARFSDVTTPVGQVVYTVALTG